MPGPARAIGRGLPLTYGIAAASELASGATLGDIGDLVLTELAIAVLDGAAGLVLLHVLALQSRRTASLEVF